MLGGEKLFWALVGSKVAIQVLDLSMPPRKSKAKDVNPIDEEMNNHAANAPLHSQEEAFEPAAVMEIDAKNKQGESKEKPGLSVSRLSTQERVLKMKALREKMVCLL